MARKQLSQQEPLLPPLKDTLLDEPTKKLKSGETGMTAPITPSSRRGPGPWKAQQHGLSRGRELVVNQFHDLGVKFCSSAVLDHSFRYGFSGRSDWLRDHDSQSPQHDSAIIFKDAYFQGFLSKQAVLQ